MAFVGALCEQVSAAGGELLLPPVPALPCRDEEDEDHRLAATFGWLRVAVGDTTGRKLHSPSCHVLKSGRGSVSGASHIPWWWVMAEDPYQVCEVCYGPCVRDLAALAGFTAAVDVWDHRGRDRVEDWQQAAFQRLLAVTVLARAEALEPDITLAHRIVDALSEDAPANEDGPAHEGWAAYALLAGNEWDSLGKEFKQRTPVQQEAARVLARDRLAVLESVLPASKRPLPLPRSADVRLLRERHTRLTRMLADDVPQLDRLLFTLPGAIRGW